MKTLGNDIYIQRGEIWSLDFEVVNEKNDPYMLFSEWKNPYLAITVTAARYEQKGDFRKTWWLDMNNRWVEQEDGTFVFEPIKRFISTEAMFVTSHTIDQVQTEYPNIAIENITNYLFYTDPNGDGKRIYKYYYIYPAPPEGWTQGDPWPTTEGYPLPPTGWAQGSPWPTDYPPVPTPPPDDWTIGNPWPTTEGHPAAPDDWTIGDPWPEYEIWKDYNFRVIKQFNTRDWVEQNYLFDIKILSGESIEENIFNTLTRQGATNIPALPWANEVTIAQMKRISDKKVYKELLELFESGQPLMPNFDTKSLVLYPTKLTVSANIQGGIR